MSLRARIVVSRGADFRLDIDLTVAAGEVVGLLGPNGAGKSTALRVLAGLLPLTDGRVELTGEVLEDVAAQRFQPPHVRPVGVVFQDYLLFPHLSVLENVAFGPRSRRVPKEAAREVARRLLEKVDLSAYAAARPRQLSGGQAQRVALARALATEPRLLLLDEPLAALDARTRVQVRGELRRRLAAFDGAAIVVSHDPLDALVLADRLVVIEDGTVVQAGTPSEVARRPRTDYVARLVGLNLLRGTRTKNRIACEEGGELVVTPDDSSSGPSTVYAAFRPSAVALYRTRPDGSPRNVWRGRIAGLEPTVDGVRVEISGAPPVTADVTAASVADLDLVPGAEIWVAVKAAEIDVYPDTV